MISRFFHLKTNFIEAERDSGFGGGDFGGVSSSSDVGGAGGQGIGGGGIGGGAGSESRSVGSVTVDLGGGVTAQVDPQTGKTIGITGGSASDLESTRAKERALASGRSVFGQKLADKLSSGKVIGGLAGLLGGAIIGQPAFGAKVGSQIGSLFDDPAEKGAGAPVGLSRQQEIQQAQQQVGIGMPSTPDLSSMLGSSTTEAVGPGQESRQQAVQIAAAGRQSGLPGQLGQQAPQLPPQRFLNQQGALPMVNLGAFPGALGRV